MPTTTPLTDSINALTTYANTVTGGADTTLSDAVATLAAGYGGGGTSYVLSITGATGETRVWSTSKLPNVLADGGCLEVEFYATTPNTDYDNIIGIGTTYNYLINWNTANSINFYYTDSPGVAVRQSSTTTTKDNMDMTVPHVLKVDKDYIYIDGEQIVATSSNIVNASTVIIGAAQGTKRYIGTYNYIHFG